MMRPSYWMIEHSHAHPATWWTGDGSRFTTDAAQALRFAREQDANTAKEHLCPYGFSYRATEHIDLPPAHDRQEECG